MGHKTHPVGFRLGVIKDWDSRWFASKQSDYRSLVLEDKDIRKTIQDDAKDAGISKIEIERSTQDITVTIHTARPPKLDRKQELGPVGRYQVAITTAPVNDIYEIIIDTITGDIVHRDCLFRYYSVLQI